MANREIVGAKASWFNPQTGPKGHVKPVGNEYSRGESAFNCFAEKSKVILNVTPLVKNPDGKVVNLEPGDPENEDVKIGYYAVILDGEESRGDDIQKTPIEVNNMDANYGLTPRYVFGPELSGNHTLNGAVEVNGFRAQAPNDLKLNG
jgi:hypothetical protein